jgi:hypothetical protein
MRKDNKARGKDDLPRYRFSFVYHYLTMELEISIFECCLLDTIINLNLHTRYSCNATFLSNYLIVRRNTVNDGIDTLKSLGLVTKDAKKKTYTATEKAKEHWEKAKERVSQKSSKRDIYTQVFHALRKKELDVSFKAYCLLDTVYQLSKYAGQCEAGQEYLEEVLGIKARDFRAKRDRLSYYLKPSQRRVSKYGVVKGIKLTTEARADFSRYFEYAENRYSPFSW